MSNSTSTRALIVAALDDVRRRWVPLAATDLLFKLLAVVLLSPLVGFVLRGTLALMGHPFLADEDLARFLLGPAGWITAVAVAAVWLGIAALELAALLHLLRGELRPGRLSPLRALHQAGRNSAHVLILTARIAATLFPLVAAFAAIAYVIYANLLWQYDINYSLQERPASFRWAVGAGAVLVTALLLTTLYLATRWLLALPLVVFQGVHPVLALRRSAERTRGQRGRIAASLTLWGAATLALSFTITFGVAALGRSLLPTPTAASAAESMRWLTFTIGATLLLWLAGSLLVHLCSAVTLAALLLRWYVATLSDTDSPFPADRTVSKSRTLRRLLTPLRLTAAVGIAALLVLALGWGFVRSVPDADKVVVMAHRGASHAAPENTLAAIRAAIDEGADWVEIDVQETADGQVVVFHDSDFMKLAKRPLKIWQARASDLAAIDIGSWFGPEFQQERVPTLAQVLELCRHRIGVIVELKYYGHDQRLEERVAELIEAHDMTSQTMLMSLKAEGVRKMKALRPKWKVGLLMSVSTGRLDKIEADFLAVNARFASRQLVRAAHQQGKPVYVWTVNDAASISAMVGRGVDGLLTDRPALARAVLIERDDMSLPERLLLDLAGTLGWKREWGEP